MTRKQWVWTLNQECERFVEARAFFVFGPLVPFDRFESTLREAELTTSAGLDSAIEVFPKSRTWPNLTQVERYFLSRRLQYVAGVADEISTAIKTLKLPSPIDFDPLFVGTLTRMWNQRGLALWLSGLQAEWERMIRTCWQQWLAAIWLDGQKQLPELYRIDKVFCRRISQDSDGSNLYHVDATLKGGNHVRFKWTGPNHPITADVEQLMIHSPELVT
ncbi:MAG TPA: hypothetical protein VK530_19270 [Candidatus Acidoferrum sp.]|nr:hypothetical protein [Candidatus Acidoferrum sp.]